MLFDAEQFFVDSHISFATEGYKQCQEGWLQIDCPFCCPERIDNKLLGYNIDASYFNCWRCGFHTNSEVIKTTLNIGWEEAKKLLMQYGSYVKTQHKKEIKQKATKTILPSGTYEGCPPNRFLRYLHKRKFNARSVALKWDLRGTSPVGRYKFRLIAPIYYNKKLVSYQGRDVTDKSPLKYKTCKSTDEVIDHKNILYGLDKCENTTCVVVEGITDVWRLGYGAVATFGIDFKTSQRQLLMERFSRIFIMFDQEVQAKKQANKLAADLSMMGVDVELLCLTECDPGDLPQDEADDLMKSLNL